MQIDWRRTDHTADHRGKEPIRAEIVWDEVPSQDHARAVLESFVDARFLDVVRFRDRVLVHFLDASLNERVSPSP